MFGINEVLNKLFSKKELTEQDKFNILQSKNIDPNIFGYLRKKLDNLYIEVETNYKGTLFELMYLEKLMGWCWETTESAIVFFNDNDYIERGNLYFDEKTPKYYHSWICFNYNETKYILDPCLNILCKKEDYSKMFKPDIKGMISAKDVKEELIRQIATPKDKDEVIIESMEDVNAPMYRNDCRYKTELENGKIKKITVHYY